jgi:hypothetical protein
MQRRLQELDRLDVRHGVGVSPFPGSYRTGAAYAPGHPSTQTYPSSPGASYLPAVPYVEHRPRRRGSLVLAAVAVLIAGGGAMHLVAPDGERLAAAPAIQPGAGSFAFMQEQLGQPVTYDPCVPIRYVVNDELAPDGGAALLAESLNTVSAATGLVFEDAGRTDEPARPGRPARDVLRYGVDPSPVLIAWTTPEQVPDLAGSVVGIGGSVAEGIGGSAMRYVSGAVYLDAAELAGILRRADGTAQVSAVITHELGHLVGLDHVDDPNELMYDLNNGRTELGAGDRQGLAAVGSGTCR